MSNAYGAGSPQAGLNAPGGMPSWLQNIYNFVNPMAAATAGGVDAQGRPQDAVTAAQQALAAQAMNGGPQASGPIAGSQAGNVSTAGIPGAAPTPPVMARSLPPRPPMMASMTSMGVDQTPPPVAGRPGPADIQALRAAITARNAPPAPPMDTGIRAAMHPLVSPAVTAYAGQGQGQGPFAGRPTVTPPSGTGQGPFAGRPVPAAGGRTITVNPHARQQAQVAAAAPAVPQVPWIKTDFRQNLPAGNGPLGRNAQTQQGMIDFSKLFNRGS